MAISMFQPKKEVFCRNMVIAHPNSLKSISLVLQETLLIFLTFVIFHDIIL
ncbi:hypothetical protein BREVNS_1175 [Brevinematales bacterium NS]|nr:hypothetical protein BREVNS_1175 [Brevinematales bacterium NS]